MNLVESIYNEPEKWKVSGYYFKHSNGARVFIVNGLSKVNINDTPIGFFQKRKIWKAYKWWSKNATIESFGNG